MQNFRVHADRDLFPEGEQAQVLQLSDAMKDSPGLHESSEFITASSSRFLMQSFKVQGDDDLSPCGPQTQELQPSLCEKGSPGLQLSSDLLVRVLS